MEITVLSGSVGFKRYSRIQSAEIQFLLPTVDLSVQSKWKWGLQNIF